MRKIIASTYMSLDGVITNPHLWSLDYWNEQAGRIAHDQLFSSDALLCGRLTYEGFAAAWPGRDGDFADRINEMSKYVVSTTLEKAEWANSTIIRDNVVDEIARLKREAGQDILMYGFGRLGHTLLRHGLMDELRFWVHPVLVGGGDGGDLLFRAADQTRLRLVDTQLLDTGVAVHSYRPVRDGDADADATGV